MKTFIAILAALLVWASVGVQAGTSAQTPLVLSVTDSVTGLADATGPAAGQVTMTVNAQQTAEMQGLQFKVTYDPAIVTVESVVKGPIPNGFLFQKNFSIAGEVSIAMVGDAAAGVSGFDVADILFNIVAAPGESTALTFVETVAGDSSIPPQPIPVSATGGTITVAGANLAPVAKDDTDTVVEGGSVEVDVLDNDSDPNGDPISISGVTAPANGTATINDNGTAGNPADDFIDYTHDGSATTVDSFTYTITDGDLFDTATVNIDVIAVGDLTLSIKDSVTGLADATGPAGGQVTMTVNVQQTAAMQGLQFKVTYNPAIVSVESVVKGPIPDGFLFQQNSGVAGEVSIALVGDAAAGVSGFDVANILFNVIGTPNESTALTFIEAVAGDSSIPPQPIPVSTTGGSITVSEASDSVIRFRPVLVGLGAIGSMTTINVEVEAISPDVNGIQLNIQHPGTLEVTSPACVGVFGGGLPTPPAATTGGTLVACALVTGFVSNTAGDAMTFDLTRVEDFQDDQIVTFGIGGPQGTQLSVSGVGAQPGSTNELVVKPGVNVSGVTTLQFVASAVGVEMTLTDNGFSLTTTADVDGNWLFTGVPNGTYKLTATAPTFLSAELIDLVVGTSEAVAVPVNELLAGDINGNEFVEINDITGIIGNFGKDVPQAWLGDVMVVAGTGVISGLTQLQFMSDSSFVELTLTGTGMSKTTMADADGNWAFPAVPAGDYTVTASAKSHLSAERTAIVLGPDQDIDLPANDLLAGDINSNDFVEINDITGTIGNFGKGAPQPWPVP